MNVSNAAPYGYAGKSGATFKSVHINAGYAIGYGDAGKAGTTPKSCTPNTGNAVSYGYASKAGAIGKSVSRNGGNAVGYGYAGKALAISKSPLPNCGNAVWYGYAGNACALKSIRINEGNWQTLNTVGNNYRRSVSFIFCNPYAAAIDDSELQSVRHGLGKAKPGNSQKREQEKNLFHKNSLCVFVV